MSLKRTLSAMRVELGVMGAVFALAGVALAAGLQGDDQGASTTVRIAPAEAAKLVDATSGTAVTDYRAIGESAEIINASLPFDSGPLDVARPFRFASGRDHDRAKTCLQQAIYYEAGFEPLQGRRAVAQVVLNRVRHPAFPDSVCGVVYQGANQPVCQFSFVCDGSLDRAPVKGAWAEAGRIAEEALDGRVEGSVGMATHYHADYVAPRWAPLLAKVKQHGAHIFYRWPGEWGRRAAFADRYIGEPYSAAALKPVRLVTASAEEVAALTEAVVPAGPPIPRAENDVGGLMDPNKGWKLTIPVSTERRNIGAALAEQQQRGIAPVATVAN